MQHISFQDILSIVGLILVPIFALIGTMWHHFNGRFKEMRGEMKEEIKGVKEEIKEIREDIKGIKQEIKEMQEDIKEIKQEIKVMQEDIKEIKQEIKVMQEDIKEVKKEMKAMEAGLSNKIDDSYKFLTQEINVDRGRISHIEGQLVPTQIIRLPAKATPKKLKTHSRAAVA